MTFHSIIIPHRNRNRALEQTLWSIRRSASACGIGDYEIVVVDALSPQQPSLSGHERLVTNHIRSKVFNKSLALNIGIEQSAGDVLTFLDADMLVGEKWMRGVLNHLPVPSPPTRLCYRVRQLKASDQWDNQEVILRMLETAVDKGRLVQGWFDSYDGYVGKRARYVKAFEAYGNPDEGNNPTRTEPVFGNSQFSIRRDVLGDLRFNDEMVGAGFEDLWMIRQIWDKYGLDYRGVILTDPDNALLHMYHPRPNEPRAEGYAEYSDGWCTEEANDANKARYKRRWPKTTW
jgi:glycosyltransferase involved in cell wall biosynthesis